MEMEIIEMEEYLGLMRHENQSFADVEDLLESLREDKAVIDMKGLEAVEQIGEVREMLDKHRIPEISLSEDGCPVYCPQPHTQSSASWTGSDSDIDDDQSDSSMKSTQPTTWTPDSNHMSSPRWKVLTELLW